MKRAFVLFVAAVLAPQGARAQSSEVRQTVASSVHGSAETSGSRQEADTLTLAEAIESALATHPLLERAAAGSDAADAGVRAARGAWLPGLSVSGLAARFEEPMVVAPLHAFDPTMPPVFDRTLLQGRVEASYRLFGGARGARVEAARAASAAADASTRAAREDVLVGVTTAYAQRVAAGARAAAAAARVSSAAEERGRAARLVAEGAAAEVENLRAEAAAAAAAADQAEAVALQEEVVRELARWMGVAPSAVRDRAAQPLAMTGPLPEDGGPSAEVERAAQEARAAEAEADVARSTRLPRLDAQAALLEYGSSEGDFQGEWQAGVQVSFPVFTGGTRGAEIDRAGASARSAAAAVEVARLRQTSDIDRWSTALTASVARIEALQRRVSALAEVERIEALALREGAGTQRAFLDAQADLFGARAALADARAGQSRAAVELARAQGVLTAGWISRTLRPAP